MKICLAAPEKGVIGQEGGKIAVSGAQTRGKTVFDGAELDFDSFSGSWKCWVGHLAITPSREAIFSLGRPYFPEWRSGFLENARKIKVFRMAIWVIDSGAKSVLDRFSVIKNGYL